MFNYKLLEKVRQRESMRKSNFAERLGVSGAYFSMLEKGDREPSLEVVCNIVRVTKIPVEKWVIVETVPDTEEISWLARNGAHAAGIKQRLSREHRDRQKAEERVWELEQTNEHLMAEIRLRKRFEDVICAEFLSKSERTKKLKKVAAYTMEEGELCFIEILRVLRVERHVLQGWLETEKQAYKCQFADNGEILASSPSEAALCLRCFDCAAFESGKCLGHGNEKRPENIIELLDRLKANGVYEGARQSRILKKYYSLSLSPRGIASIRYRVKNGLHVPEDVFYLDARKNK